MAGPDPGVVLRAAGIEDAEALATLAARTFLDAYSADTAVWVTSDADGNYLSSYTLEGYPTVSEDGQTFSDDMSRVVVTVRDPLGVVTDVIHPSDAPPVKGNRMGPGAPGVPDFPWAAASAAP
jgi:hypothetical protein